MPKQLFSRKFLIKNKAKNQQPRADRIFIKFSDNLNDNNSKNQGCGVMRKYFLPDGISMVETPFGNNVCNSSSLTVGCTIQA